MSISDIASSVSAFAATAAALFAAYQIRQLGVQDRSKRASELASVALETHVISRPRTSEVVDGRWDWEYEFRLVNPGRLSISDVVATVAFPGEVVRVHDDESLDSAKPTLVMKVPVLGPQSSKTWSRVVRMSSEVQPSSDNTTASVLFFSSDAGRLRTSWPQTQSDNTDLKLVKLMGRFTVL